jgi:DNA-binding transcriptional LysR family regulator
MALHLCVKLTNNGFWRCLKPMDRVHHIEMLVRAADAGSFAKAALFLGLTPSAVSRAIAELERHLRVTLFYRTTRQLRLTEDGEELYRRGREILDKLAEVETAVSRAQARLTGTLGVGMAVGIARHVVMPRIPEFMRRHPDLKIECRVLSQPKDMHASGIDLLFRLGDPPESTLIARKLLQLRYAVYAAPEYLKLAGEPTHPDDLMRHRCLIMRSHWASKPLDEWEFERKGERRVVKVPSTLITDDREGLMTAALAGGGLIRTGMFDPAQIAAGRLRKVLNDWTCPRGPDLYALYRKTPHPSPKITAFLDFLSETFTAFDPEEITLLHNKSFGELRRRSPAMDRPQAPKRGSR